MKIKIILLILCTIAIFISCSDVSAPTEEELNTLDTANTYYQNQIFRHTGLISPVYEDSGGTSTPMFSWYSTGYKYVVLAIFTERIKTLRDEIENYDKVIWIWTTTIGKGKEGNVRYSHGARVENGQVLRNTEPAPLSSGTTYYWALWAFDDAYHLRGSSIEYQLIVP